MKTIKTRIFSCLLAVMLAIPAFSMSALAAGTDPEAAESIPTTAALSLTRRRRITICLLRIPKIPRTMLPKKIRRKPRSARTLPPSSRSCWAS